MHALGLVLQCTLLLTVAGCAGSAARHSPHATGRDTYRVDAEDVIIKAARSLMESDENMALVSVDDEGQPRVRTVRAFLGDVDLADHRKTMTVWVMTRDSTRKVEQLRRHPQVTLYFNDDEKFSYLTIMGTATVHTDPTTDGVKPFLALEGYKEFFWPRFPEGFVMIEIQPDWIEFMGPGVKNHPLNWRPQAVELPAR